jgi:hypothetical protein
MIIDTKHRKGARSMMKKYLWIGLSLLFLFSSCKFTPFTPDQPGQKGDSSGSSKSNPKDGPPPPLGLQGQTARILSFSAAVPGDRFPLLFDLKFKGSLTLNKKDLTR